MAATGNALVVKRLGHELTEGFQVYLTCSVQMFKFSKGGEMQFQRLLPRGTWAKLDLKKSKEAMALGFKFYYVRTGAGSGYVPKAAFHDFVYAQLNDTPYTGVSYGGDKLLTNGDGSVVAFPANASGNHPCQECGCPVNYHKLYETYDLTGVLNKLISSLSEATAAGAFKHSGFMLAALRTKGDQFAVAYSGTLGPKDRSEFEYCVSLLAERPAVAVPLQGGEYLRDKDEKRTYLNNAAAWSCAAPRAIQCAWGRLDDYPIEMSEKWFGTQKGIAIEGHTIKSCDVCRQYLPLMLCGTAFMRL